MPNGYIERSLEPVVRRAAREFPAVVLTGPRQSGKTTMLKHLFPKHGYVSLEPPNVRLAATEDPLGFIDAYPPPVIFDEVQYAPGLLPYIKERIDAARSKRGQFLLTGSQNLLLMERVTESLAGRAAMLKLLPLSRREIASRPQSPFPWETRKSAPPSEHRPARHMWTEFLRGCYPELIAYPKRDAIMWHASYVQTYLERDVRTLRQVGDLRQFQNFVLALAARSAQLLNMAELSRELGIVINTAKAWLSVLEATYQVIVLRPYFANINKRLAKTPKVYFTDVGTLCYLTGLQDPQHAAAGPMGGAIMETAVVSEIFKSLLHRGTEPRIYFWRTSGGAEVDIVLEMKGKLVPIEVKLSSTPKPAMASGVRAFRRDFGGKAAPGYVIHAGDSPLPLVDGVTALPFTEL